MTPCRRLVDQPPFSGEILEIFRDLAIAVLLVGAVSGYRLVLAPVLYGRAAFLLYGLAVMFCAWWRGRRAGFIATFLATAVGTWLFVAPYPERNPLENEAHIVLFALEGAGISLMAGKLYAARRQAEEEAANTARSRAELSDLIESIEEGFQALDRDFRVTFMNHAAHAIFGWEDAQPLGRTFWEQFPGMDPDVEQMLRGVMTERSAARCETYYAPMERWLAVNAYPFREGISVLFNDISDRKNAQSERERLIQELQEALANIRTLRGLIPICAWCKKIRNDRGYWEHLEKYLDEHSEAKFTHGMCPECVVKYSGK